MALVNIHIYFFHICLQRCASSITTHESVSRVPVGRFQETPWSCSCFRKKEMHCYSCFWSADAWRAQLNVPLCLASLVKGKYWRLIYLQVAHEREVWVRSAQSCCAGPTTRYHFCVRSIDQGERQRPRPLPSTSQMGKCCMHKCK